MTAVAVPMPSVAVASHPAWCLRAAKPVVDCELFDPDDAPIRWLHCGAERTVPAYDGHEIGLCLVRQELDDGRSQTLIDVDKNGHAAFRLNIAQARLLMAELNYLLACQETR